MEARRLCDRLGYACPPGTRTSGSAADRALGFGEDGTMKPGPASHVRIARPSHDLRASERFWVGGLGLEVLLRVDESADGGHALVMVGAGGARVAARNPYWDQWGVTIADPDGYRLVLSALSWP
jgi:hypothetical protein